MIPFQVLALVALFAAEPPTRPVDPIAAMLRDMPPPDWLQRELRGAPPTTMADTNTTTYHQTPTYAPPPLRDCHLPRKERGVTWLSSSSRSMATA